MKSKLFCIRDQKIGIFQEPFPCPTDKAALRSLEAAVQQGQGDLGKFPGDFDLYEIGNYDPETGTVEAYKQPKHLTSCLAFENQVAKPAPVRDDIVL